ncbi:uncharacterized protein LOC119570815 [Penaeus monodon]|uniref:uncharacterized protein LOC119570815 n=1 Tax=Penaeus monodon TaxID=6687 RepID=UPI0018A75D27|nr:uncharacterized protein LOC119570815 [Penaeus monodon]
MRKQKTKTGPHAAEEDTVISKSKEENSETTNEGVQDGDEKVHARLLSDVSKISKRKLSAGNKKPQAKLLSDVSKVSKKLRAAEEDDIFISRPRGEDGETSDEEGDDGDEKAHVRLLNDMSKISKKEVSILI